MLMLMLINYVSKFSVSVVQGQSVVSLQSRVTWSLLTAVTLVTETAVTMVTVHSRDGVSCNRKMVGRKMCDNTSFPLKLKLRIKQVKFDSN